MSYRFTITAEMLKHRTILSPRDWWKLREAIGPLQRQDVGKRVYETAGVLQVENDEQRAKREARKVA